MKCPVCKEEMLILELNQIEIDYCPLCDGIWLDEGELELLLENHEAKDKLLSTFTIDSENKEKRYRCPRCSKKMNKVLVGDQKQILIDKCRKQHGLWFDSGELNEVVKLGSIDADNRVINLLNEMFGHKIKEKNKI